MHIKITVFVDLRKLCNVAKNIFYIIQVKDIEDKSFGITNLGTNDTLSDKIMT